MSAGIIPVSEATAGVLRNVFVDTVSSVNYPGGKVVLGPVGTITGTQGGAAVPEDSTSVAGYVQERSQLFEFSYNPTISTSAYVDGYELGTVQTVSSTVRTGSGVVIDSINVADKDKQAASLEFLFFRATVASGGTDHAAFNPSDTESLLFCGGAKVQTTDYRALSSNSVACITNLGLRIHAVAANSLFMAVVVRGTPTYSATGIGVRVAGRYL